MTDASPLTDKAALRAQMRTVRAAAAAPGAAEAAASHAPLDLLAGFAVVSGYVAQGSELSPLPLLQRLAAKGAVACLPVAEDRHAPLSFRRWAPGDDLIPDAFGIPAPTPDKEALCPSLVITPLLAFDRRGGRLGQGAGHYDRTIEALRRRGPVFVLGFGYADQEIPEAPLEAHDQPLDGVLTENGYIAVSKASR